MLGRCGEVGFIKDGACFNGVAAGDGFVGETVNEDYIVFGNFDGSNGHVVLGVKNGYFCAGADGAAKGCCAGCGIDNEELTFVGCNLGVLCPEELVGVVIPNSGLNVLKTMACSADRGAIAVGEVDGVENSIVCFVAETVCIAAAVDCKGHDGVSTCIESSNFGKSTGCKVYGVDGTTVCIVCCDSVHFAFCMVVCHSNNNAACAGAGVCNLVGVSVHDVEAGVVGVAVIHEAVYIAACECAAEGGAHCAEVFDNAGIIISETAPDAGSTVGIECDVAFKVYSGQSLGYGNGCGTGNGGICNGGYGNGGGAFRNADNNAVFVNGCDCGVCNAEGNVLVECLCGENRVSNGCPAAGGNGYVFNFDGGGNYGCADVYIVNVCIVAFLINGAVLLIGPGDGVFTCGELNCIGGPGFNAVPLCNFGAVNKEVETIPNGVAEAFAEGAEVELEDVTCCRGNRGGNRGGGTCNVDVGALAPGFFNDPGIIAVGGEVEGAACNVHCLIQVADRTGSGRGNFGGGGGYTGTAGYFNDRINIGVFDGSGSAAHGEVVELNNVEIKVVFAVRSVSLRTESESEQSAVCGESGIGHHCAETNAAGNAEAIKNCGTAVFNHLVHDSTGLVVQILECIGIIVKTEVENMCLVVDDTADVHCNLEFFACRNACRCCSGECNIEGNQRGFGDRSGRYGGVGGAAAAGNLNEVEVEPEHVGDAIVTERNLNGLTCICADVYAALLIGVGSGEVTEFGTGGAVCDYIYAEGFSRIAGILTCIPEGNGAACGECRADEPVVGSQCSAAAECAVLEGSGCHAVGAFVYVVVGTACIHPFPVVAVAVVIADGPAFSEGIGFKAPTGCTGVGSGSGSGCGCDSRGGSRSGFFDAGSYGDVSPVVLTIEGYR